MGNRLPLLFIYRGNGLHSVLTSIANGNSNAVSPMEGVSPEDDKVEKMGGK